MDGGSADHAGAVICRHAGEFADAGRSRPHGGLLQRFYYYFCNIGTPPPV
jgi:hypothetical protein